MVSWVVSWGPGCVRYSYKPDWSSVRTGRYDFLNSFLALYLLFRLTVS